MEKRGISCFELVFKNKILPNSKHSQVTVFIIIAIVLITLTTVFFVLKDNLKISNKDFPEITQIDSIIQECSEQRTIDAIRLIGLQGGYITLSEKYLETNISDIAYGLYNREKTLLSKNQIENEIEHYIEITLPFCINEDDFPDLNITQKKAQAKVKINQDSVEVSTKLPIAVSKQESSFTINRNYESEIPIRLGKIYDTADEIIEKQLQEPEYIDLTYLTSLEYNVVMIPFNDNILIYTITDDNSEINEIPYSFMFASKF